MGAHRPTTARAVLLFAAVTLTLAHGAAARNAFLPFVKSTDGKSGGSGGSDGSSKALPLFPAGLPRVPADFPQNILGAPMAPNPLPENAYRGTYGHTTCAADVLLRPNSTEELAAAVKATAARAGAERRALKMRATRQGFASIASFPCIQQPSDPPAAANGSAAAAAKPALRVGVMMDRMSRLLAVDKANNQISVEAQMTLKELYAAANAHGLSVPRMSLPWWQGLTLAGIHATSAHGSGNNVTSMICDWVVNVTWVDAAGTIYTSPKGSPEARALCGGIGLLGIVARFALQLTPASNTRVTTLKLQDDDNIAADVERLLNVTPHVVILWRPDLKKYTAHMQRPADPSAPVIADAVCNIIPEFPPATAAILGPSLRSWQNDPENTDPLYYAGFDVLTCQSALATGLGSTWAMRKGPLSSLLAINTPIDDGVAPTNNVISTDCGDNCAWLSKGMQATVLDVELAFERARLAEWVADIKALIAKDLEGLPGWGAGQRCFLPGYFVMRFGKGGTGLSLVGMEEGLKQPVYVQQQLMESANTPGVPSRYEWVQDTYEQLTLCKYGGYPHMGKNFDRTFSNPRCPLAPKHGARLKQMTALQDTHDPARVFEPELWARMAAGKSYPLKPRCQLDRSCYCAADEHCAAGFKCVPSIAFPEYKVCRPVVMNH